MLKQEDTVHIVYVRHIIEIMLQGQQRVRYFC